MLLVLVAMPARSSEQQADPVMEAMLQELDRSVNLLRLEAGDYDLPYFVYYAVRDVRSSFVSARNGALQSSNDGRTRMADVDIRVGSYDMDSSEDKDAGFNFNQKYNPGFMGPIDDSIPALRRTLWLLSDHAYKAALMSFHNVKAKLVNSSEPRKSASLSREQPVELIEEISEAEFDRPAREGHARELSAIFLQYPDIFDSGVEISAFRVVRYIVNSEGTRIRTVDQDRKSVV